MLKTVTGGISAGIMVAIGGTVFLSCDSRYVGAFLFSVALLCICSFGYYLYTGRIAYVTEDHSAKNIRTLAVGLASNLAATLLLGLLIRFALPALEEKAAVLCRAKLEQSFIGTFIRASFCGILMYCAVQIYKVKNTPLGIIFCIPVFILSGYEHSIADMFYFGASGITDAKIISFELAAILGNTAGSLILPLLSMAGEKDGKG